MQTIYIDADACPVKDEIYRVASRYHMKVVVVANTTMWTPSDPLVSMVVQTGFGAADDWIAEQSGPGDITITADIPLAARCIEKGGLVLGHKGLPWTESSIGEALAMRNLMEELRQSGTVSGGPSPLNAKDRSRFLAKLDEMVNAVRKRYPKAKE
jgi:uncharacterized protein YaiI (UPF0178 family)